MPYWRATVQRPDGNGGWITVGVYGTPETPGKGSARYLHGDDPFDTAMRVLDFIWPINLEQFNARKDPDRWADQRRAKTGIADHRITIDVTESNRWSHDGNGPEPQAFTVAELHLAAVRAQVKTLAETRAKLKEISEQARRLRSEVRHHQYRIENARDDAILAGVGAPEVAKASRAPRPPRKPKTTRAAVTPPENGTES